MFVYIILSLFSMFSFACNNEMTSVINIDTSKVLTQVDERFLSVALGMINKNWKQLDLNNPRVINMAKALSPAFLRLGGTGADLATFDKTRMSNDIPQFGSFKNRPQNDGNDKHRIKDECHKINLRLQKSRKNVTITQNDWIDLNSFTQKVNWTLLFDVNVILKRADGCWDSSNFQKLLEFSSSSGYSPIAWELGMIYGSCILILDD